MDYEQLEALLGQVRLFARLSGPKLKAVLRRLQPLQFPAGRVILEEGRPIKFMFIVGDGTVEVRRKDPRTGISFLLRTMEAGDNFGEMALLAGKPYTCSLMTVTPTILFILNQENFRNLIQEEPEISVTLNQLLAEQLMSAYDQVGIQAMDMDEIDVELEVARLIPPQLALMHRMLPIAKRGHVLTLAMVQPGNLIAHDDVKRLIRDVIIEPMLISEEDFDKHFEILYPGARASRGRSEKSSMPGTAASAISSATSAQPTVSGTNFSSNLMGDDDYEMLQQVEVNEEEDKPSLADLEQQSTSGPVVKLANAILVHALRMGASDIHLEPQEQGLVVRFRVDGRLRVIQVLPSKLMTALVSRVKILSNLDITERRVPQDGRISSAFQGRRVDFRVSTVPAKYGEKVCLRILDNSMSNIQLEQLITHQPTYERLRDLIEKPHGIIFVTGPTGSGKTTTLYSALGEINTPDINISTVEDPIEYDLAGINQVQVQRSAGVDFARILRAFLRQDPDVILVGETRDAETARTAVEAALTGHLVFTTLHTNSAAASFARLEEMGVEPFMVACATMGVLAQRLARRLCPHCKTPDTPDRDMLAYLGFADDDAGTVMRAVGCDKCSQEGFKGRIGVYELMIVDDVIRPLISKSRSAEEIESAAVQAGMWTLSTYGRWLIREGETTLEEVLRVISFD